MSQVPSKYQAAVYNFIEKGQGNLIVDSVAGSGKTTTLLGIANRLPKDVESLFVAFNKHIATELQARLPQHVEARTIHSLGVSTLKANRVYATLDNLKYTGSKGIVADLSKKLVLTLSDEEREELNSAANALVGFVRLTLTGPNSVEAIHKVAEAFNNWKADNLEQREVRAQFCQELLDLSVDYDLDLPASGRLEALARIVINALATGIKQAQVKGGSIDFTDMIWLPVILRLPTKQFDYLLVDEAQDLNRCQLNLVGRALKKGGRFIFVGDRRQAIYRFAGADSSSMQRIKDVLSCTELPLSICYRCPSSHVSLAAGLYPGIEARPNAPAGELSHDVEEDQAIRDARPSTTGKLGDLFICRNTAPTVKLAYRLIRSGKAAKVRGKSIGEGLTALTKKIALHGKRNGLAEWSDFDAATDAYFKLKVAEAQGLKEDKRDAAIDALTDKIETLAVIKSTRKPESLTEFKDAITALFDDKEGNCVWLSTIHKSKGLEAERVFFMEPQLVPSKFAKSVDAREQEKHLMYIAFTRAKQSLFIMKPGEKAGDSELGV